MKKPDVTLLLLSATLFLGAGTTAFAQETPPPDESAPPPPRAEWIKRFDKNGDDKLDETERAEARKEFAKKHPRLAQKMKSGKRGPGSDEFRRGYALGKFDKNGDGKLDETERAAARAEGEQRLRTNLEQQLQRLKAIDADGDGKISDSEWAATKADREKMRAERGPGSPDGPGPRGFGRGHHDGPPPPEDHADPAADEPKA